MQNRRTEPYTLDYFPYTKGQLNRWGHDKASDWLRGKVEKEAQTNWDSFYKNNGDKFFKKRHWITREYEELRDSDRNVVHTFLEVGCGTGATCMSNTLYSIHTVVFPLLEEFNPNLRVFAFDLSQHAIDIINKHELTLHPKYDNQITAFVYDATSESEQDIPHVAPNSIDCTFHRTIS
jgi:methyltransferase-like protein 6